MSVGDALLVLFWLGVNAWYLGAYMEGYMQRINAGEQRGPGGGVRNVSSRACGTAWRAQALAWCGWVGPGKHQCRLWEEQNAAA